MKIVATKFSRQSLYHHDQAREEYMFTHLGRNDLDVEERRGEKRRAMHLDGCLTPSRCHEFWVVVYPIKNILTLH